jgi:hypothetical protein
MESTRALRADLFDPASLAALGRIEIVARWIVDGFMSGLHRSPRKGFSVEFAEYRPYQPGDDLRYVDWKIAARSDRWVVRQYEEETNLRASIVLDVSRSMAWSGAQMRSGAASTGQARTRDTATVAQLTKLEYAERLTAALALSVSCASMREFERPCRRAPATGNGAASSPRSRNRARGAPPAPPRR